MLFLVNELMTDIGIAEAGLIGLVGYAVVFFGLILLMFVVLIVGKIMVASQKKQQAAGAAAKAQEAAVASAPAVPGNPAPGSAGQIKLYGTSERDAAMIMAIVADKLQKPLNELRFISIREVK